MIFTFNDDGTLKEYKEPYMTSLPGKSPLDITRYLGCKKR